MSWTSKFLLAISLCVIVWFGWKQYRVWFPPPNIPSFVQEAFRNSELEFFSLSPKHRPENKEAEKFHGFEVLGKMIISDKQTRAEMIDALESAIGKTDFAPRCYWPRHGIRCNHQGKEIDLIVCFECSPVIVYVDGKSIYHADISDDRATSEAAKKLLNDLLQSKGLPINAPPF